MSSNPPAACCTKGVKHEYVTTFYLSSTGAMFLSVCSWNFGLLDVHGRKNGALALVLSEAFVMQATFSVQTSWHPVAARFSREKCLNRTPNTLAVRSLSNWFGPFRWSF